jgi:hypothetical protein
VPEPTGSCRKAARLPCWVSRAGFPWVPQVGTGVVVENPSWKHREQEASVVEMSEDQVQVHARCVSVLFRSKHRTHSLQGRKRRPESPGEGKGNGESSVRSLPEASFCFTQHLCCERGRVGVEGVSKEAPGRRVLVLQDAE